jgi:hypothetical protein
MGYKLNWSWYWDIGRYIYFPSLEADFYKYLSSSLIPFLVNTIIEVFIVLCVNTIQFASEIRLSLRKARNCLYFHIATSEIKHFFMLCVMGYVRFRTGLQWHDVGDILSSNLPCHRNSNGHCTTTLDPNDTYDPSENHVSFWCTAT